MPLVSRESPNERGNSVLLTNELGVTVSAFCFLFADARGN